MKICGKCKQLLSLDSFRWKNERVKQSYCIECNKQVNREHYQANKSKYMDRIKHEKSIVREWFKDYKSKLACIVCGESHIACVEFHHLNGNDKLINVSEAINRGWSILRIQQEIKKCIVLCSNCHRKLHYEEKLNKSD